MVFMDIRGYPWIPMDIHGYPGYQWISMGATAIHRYPWISEEINWALVSEPGFLDVQISRFPILDIFVFRKTISKNMLVRYRGINNKGVLERPWTKWRVLRAISTTLKCQFTGKC